MPQCLELPGAGNDERSRREQCSSLFLSYITTNPAQINMESLGCHRLLHMKLLLDVAENLKHHKKKKLDEEAVVHDASMLLGLSDETISDALKNLAKTDILVLRDNPCINYMNKMDLSKHLVARFLEKTAETSTDILDSEHQQPHAPSITTTSPQTSAVSKDIYSSFSHLASSFVEVQKVIEKEREINRCLLIENAKFISQLGDSAVTVESPSRCESDSNPDNEAIENKQTPIVLEDIRSKTMIEIAENRARTNRKGKSKKKASNLSKQETSTSSDSTTDPEIANLRSLSASASTSRKNKLSAMTRKTQIIITSNLATNQLRKLPALNQIHLKKTKRTVVLPVNHSHRQPAQITKEHGQKTRSLSQEIYQSIWYRGCCQTKTPSVNDTTQRYDASKVLRLLICMTI